MRSIMLACTSANTRVFRNNCGKLLTQDGRYVSFGLGNGSSDLIAIREGIFCAIEVKLPGQKATKAQQDFIAMVRKMGGLAGVAHSVDEAMQILNGSIL